MPVSKEVSPFHLKPVLSDVLDTTASLNYHSLEPPPIVVVFQWKLFGEGIPMFVQHVA